MKKNKFLKGVVGTVLICSMAIPVFAASTVSANNEIKIIFEGKDRTPPSNTPAILWNGSTYVPLRYIGELMGKSVIWDSNTKTVSIDSFDTKQSETLKPSQEINDTMTASEIDSHWTNRGTIKTEGEKGTFISKGSLILEGIFPSKYKCEYTVEFEVCATRYTMFQIGLSRTKDNFTDKFLGFTDGLYYQKNDTSERTQISKFNPKWDTEQYHKLKFEISDKQCNISVDGNYLTSCRLEGEGELSTFCFQSIGDWEGYYVRNFKLY